jgi:hypothetical protein
MPFDCNLAPRTEMNMTPVLTRPQSRKSPHFQLSRRRSRMERLLREAAFVLAMTKQVKEAILTGQPLAVPQ